MMPSGQPPSSGGAATFWVAVAFTAVSLVPALLLPGRRAAAASGDGRPSGQDGDGGHAAAGTVQMSKK
jgi:hypothetical protein